jgi:hypothetical protein
VLEVVKKALLLFVGVSFPGSEKHRGLQSVCPRSDTVTHIAVLHDVYYVQSNVDQQTKEVSNVLVKRGKEWHGPDRMIISERSIVFVEPVGPDSKVAQLIAESQKRE